MLPTPAVQVTPPPADEAQPRFLNRAGAARHLRDKWGLGCTPRSMAKMAVQGDGPLFHKAGRKLTVYSIEHLDAWAEARLSPPVRSTSEYAARAA